MKLIDPRLVIVKICEVCLERDAVAIFRRTWHDGSVDHVLMCLECGQDDPDGVWKVEKES